MGATLFSQTVCLRNYASPEIHCSKQKLSVFNGVFLVCILDFAVHISKLIIPTRNTTKLVTAKDMNITILPVSQP